MPNAISFAVLEMIKKNSVKPRRHRTVEIDISTLLLVIVQRGYLRLMEWVNCIGNFSEFEG